MDHLDHRFWIEANHVDTLWVAKAFFYRLSCLHNCKLMKLAVENYKLRQSIYQSELEQVKRWSKEWGLSDMGFGREKTTYCYFGVVASNSLSCDSAVQLIVAKSVILITVVDDFFDMKGSLEVLRSLNDRIQRWEGKGLRGHGKIIFEALNGLVSDIAKKHLHQQGTDITQNLRDIWRETFESWLVEATWSNNGYIPSIDEYLHTGMISIASHTLVLPASCFLNPNLPNHKIKPSQYEPITKLLMASARLLNDIQSYQKEQLDGKTNLVLLHQKGNPKAEIEDSIAYVKELLDEKKRVIGTCFDGSSNRFDSNTELVQDIKRAIYIPPENSIPKQSSFPCSKVHARLIGKFEYRGRRNFNGQNFSVGVAPRSVQCDRVIIPPRFKLSSI